MILLIVTFFALACLISLILTALVRELAPRLGLTDHPDGHRKLHRVAMPLGGGFAILMATVSVLGVVLTEVKVLTQPNVFRDILWQHWSSMSSLLAGGLVIVIVGLIDDRVTLRGWQKLIGQIVAVSILIYGGLMINRIGLFGWTVELGWFALPVTLFWLLGAVNALNLLDGIDGLATTIGVILTATIAVMALKLNRPEVALIGFVFAGSLLGFLRFNFPPATIFLGDTGSMLIGLMVGALAMQGSLKGSGTVLLAAPLAVWAIPIFDSTAAILRRKLTGRSIYTTDRGHLHHRLLYLLGDNRKVLAWLAVCCILTSGAALVSVFLSNDLVALLTCSAIVVIFVVTGVFGRVELLLLGTRIREVGRSLVNPMAADAMGVRESAVRLEGSHRWDVLWDAFTESADKLGLTEIRLNVHLPAMHEGFHASWERPEQNKRERCWRLELPLTVTGRTAGRLMIGGTCCEGGSANRIQQLMDLVEPFEMQVTALCRQQAAASEPAVEATVSEHQQAEDSGRAVVATNVK